MIQHQHNIFKCSNGELNHVAFVVNPAKSKKMRIKIRNTCAFPKFQFLKNLLYLRTMVFMARTMTKIIFFIIMFIINLVMRPAVRSAYVISRIMTWMSKNQQKCHKSVTNNEPSCTFFSKKQCNVLKSHAKGCIKVEKVLWRFLFCFLETNFEHNIETKNFRSTCALS